MAKKKRREELTFQTLTLLCNNDYIMTQYKESCVCVCVCSRDGAQYPTLWLLVSERVAQHVCPVSCGLEKHREERKEY